MSDHSAKAAIEYLQSRIASGDMPPEEPVFVLRARDKYAAQTVRVWRGAVIGDAPDEKCQDADECAIQMDDWLVKQVPGRPDTRVDKRGIALVVEATPYEQRALWREHARTNNAVYLSRGGDTKTLVDWDFESGPWQRDVIGVTASYGETVVACDVQTINKKRVLFWCFARESRFNRRERVDKWLTRVAGHAPRVSVEEFSRIIGTL